MRPTDDIPHTVGRQLIREATIADGAHSRRAGQSQDYNPYAKGTQSYSDWAAGWRRPSMYIGEAK